MTTTRWQTESLEDPRPKPMFWLHGPQKLPRYLTDTWEWSMTVEELLREAGDEEATAGDPASGSSGVS